MPKSLPVKVVDRKTKKEDPEETSRLNVNRRTTDEMVARQKSDPQTKGVRKKATDLHRAAGRKNLTSSRNAAENIIERGYTVER